MSNQNNEKVTKMTFEFDSDLLRELKLMAFEKDTTQKALLNEFLEDGLKEWRKSKGQTTFDG